MEIVAPPTETPYDKREGERRGIVSRSDEQVALDHRDLTLGRSVDLHRRALGVGDRVLADGSVGIELGLHAVAHGG